MSGTAIVISRQGPLVAMMGVMSMIIGGCATTAERSTSQVPAVLASSVGGSVHGGQQPISGALVRLYATGTTGYGSAGTLFATTISSTNGGYFSFNKAATNTGPTSPSTPSYGCPATGDPEMYIAVAGGNTQSSGTSNNTAVGMAVAIGKCSAISSSTFITVNEVTTIATMTALQQFFNPAIESFGSPATPQALLGLVNAVSNVTNLANVAGGGVAVSVVPPSQVAGVTLTLTPEYQKLNLEANILAACINTTDSSSIPCTRLFSATPPPPAVVTSQPGQTFPPAADTLQAIYYMLTNPTSGGAVNMTTLFGLALPFSPFQPMLMSAPTDWTIAIGVNAGNSSCGPGGGKFIHSAVSIASDANGTIWIGNSQSSTGNLSALLPGAVPYACALGNVDASQGGATLDADGNVFFGGHHPGSSTIYRVDPTGHNPVTINTTGPTFGLAADNAGDVFYAIDSAGTLFEIPRGSTAPVNVGSIPQSASDSGFLAVDGGQNVFYAGGSNGTVYEFPLSTTTGLSNFYASPVAISMGASIDIVSLVVGVGGTIWAVDSSPGGGSLVPIRAGAPGTPTASQAGGLSTPRGSAADGAGNIWVANNSPNASGSNSISEFSAAGASLTPDGSNGGFQKTLFQSSQALTIDPSGNVWVTSGSTLPAAASTIVEIVGAAVPSIAPIALDHGVRPAPLRTPISGLIDMGDIAFHNFPGNISMSTTADFNNIPGVFGAYVINVTWAQLQPAATSIVASGNPIDTQLQMVRAYNAANPSAPLRVKLRVWPGVNAPDWAKALDGGPVLIYRNSGANKAMIPVGHYWSQPYIAAWRTLQQQLAALYDNEPLISTVAVTSCSAQTDEPFVPSGDTVSLQNLYLAHYNSAVQTACLSGAIADYSSWHNASLDYTFNLYVNKDGPNQMPPAGPNLQLPSFTFSVMTACRAALGSRCILNNHAINCPVDSGNKFVYVEMGALGGPVNLQTAAPGSLPNPWTPVVQQSIAFGASAIELWDGTSGFPSLPSSQVITLDNLFTSAGSGAPCP